LQELNRERRPKALAHSALLRPLSPSSATADAPSVRDGTNSPNSEEGLRERLDKAKKMLKTGKGPTHLRNGFEKSKRAQRAVTAAAAAAKAEAAVEAAPKKGIPSLGGTTAATKVSGDTAVKRTNGVSPEERAAALAIMAALQRGELHSTPLHESRPLKTTKKSKAKHMASAPREQRRR